MEFLSLIGKLVVSVVMVFFFIRLMGNKELKQSTPIEFAYLVLLISIAWDLSLEDEYNVFHVFILLFVLTCLIALLDWLTFKFKIMEKLFIGKPIIIIKNGVLDNKELEKQRISEYELNGRLREKGIFNIEEVEMGILENNGELSIKKKEF